MTFARPLHLAARLRAAIGVLALYGLLLQPFLAAIGPGAALPDGALCVSHPASDHGGGPAAPDGGCCVAACLSGGANALLAGGSSARIAAPGDWLAAPYARASVTALPPWSVRGPSARGPPTV